MSEKVDATNAMMENTMRESQKKRIKSIYTRKLISKIKKNNNSFFIFNVNPIELLKYENTLDTILIGKQLGTINHCKFYLSYKNELTQAILNLSINDAFVNNKLLKVKCKKIWTDYYEVTSFILTETAGNAGNCSSINDASENRFLGWTTLVD